MSCFSFSCNPKPSCSVLKNDKLRITLLTPCLLRLETGTYTDKPTQTVWNRNLDPVRYTAKEQGDLFTIYTEETTFCIDLCTQSMISVTLEDGTVVTDFEKGNLLGTARTLDGVNGSTELDKGILSKDGVAVMDDSHSLILEQDGRILPREKCRDLYFFAYGHHYLRCLKDFFRLTGQVPLIPKFALGNWWSRYKAYTQEEYRDLMQRFIRRNIPITVATIDMDWHWTDVMERFGKDADPCAGMTAQETFYNKMTPGWTGYSWNTELFPDYRELLHWLKEQGFHITLNVHPSQGVRFFEDCFHAVCEKIGADPAETKRIPFDITNLRFVQSYFDDIHHPYESDGVDFWWLDWQQGKKTAIPGLDPLWALNHYHFLDNSREGKQPLILSRYAGLGSHRYPLGFSGDTSCTWESLEFQPYFTNNASNAGYSWWSHDIGGHHFGTQDDELYIRWLQYGVFSPINRLHSTCNEFMGKEPWKRSYVACRIAEDFLRLRHKMIPYLHSANYKTHLEGLPICCPMYYYYDCEDAYKVPNQYLFGHQLLVAPIVKPTQKQLNLASVRVWLPEGNWTDIFTNRIYQGGRWVTMHRDLDAIPVLAREGAIIPMYQNCHSNDLSLDQPLEIHVWRGNGSFDLFDDDGTSAYASTPMTVESHADHIRFQIGVPKGSTDILPKKRTVTIIFRDIESAEFCVNGNPAEGKGNRITLTIGKETLIIDLSNIHILTNPPAKELETDLFTRVQWDNLRKAEMFHPEKYSILPAYLRDALSEFQALVSESS